MDSDLFKQLASDFIGSLAIAFVVILAVGVAIGAVIAWAFF